MHISTCESKKGCATMVTRLNGIDLNLTVTGVSDCNVTGTPNLASDVTGGIDLLTGDSIDDSMDDLSGDLTGVPGSLDVSVISNEGNDNVTDNKSFEARRKEVQRKKKNFLQ